MVEVKIEKMIIATATTTMISLLTVIVIMTIVMTRLI